MGRIVIFLSGLALSGIIMALVLRPPVNGYGPGSGVYLTPPKATVSVEILLGTSIAEVRQTGAVPPKLYARLPAGMDEVPAGPERKQRFIATLLPLILQVNQALASDRERMIALLDKVEEGQMLTQSQTKWLMDLARWARVEGDRPQDLDRSLLVRRVAPVPVSLALAQGAIESGWGSSRFARQGNALYGQWTWDEEDEGIVPNARIDGATHRIRAFDTLAGSVRAYARNLASGRAYARFRSVRANGGSVYDMAATLTAYSERGQDYVDDLLGIIRSNSLTDFDRARLAAPSTS